MKIAPRTDYSKLLLGKQFLRFCMADFLYSHFPYMKPHHLRFALDEFTKDTDDDELVEIGALYSNKGTMGARKYVMDNFSSRSVDIASIIKSKNAKTELVELLKLGKIRPNLGPLSYVSANGEVRVTVNDWLFGEGISDDPEAAKEAAAQNALDKFYSSFDETPTPLQKFK